mmetsp:Transcript_130523/g.325610  ORF Transcript_130523/g.325610 Transcript_130523/m.325610 type:complete len:330 (-) Transcript_130523:214-1203(-)
MTYEPLMESVPTATDVGTPRTGGYLDMRRQAAIAKGGITDHRGEVMVVRDPNFDLDKTIFQTLEGLVPRAVMKRDIGVVAYWNDAAVQRIARQYSRIERPLSIDQPLTNFMMLECNFSMEHADGSFMDHLTFCHDYCAVHYKEHSPRVLLLHSILGVGTNYFPMEAEKIPKLAELLTPFEMKHIESFPSILRLLLSWQLLPELQAKIGSLDKFEGIKFHRVIDNQELELDAEEFWVQLNYQMIHFLDFVPTADWEKNVSMTIFQGCLALYDFLTQAGQMRVTVSFDPVAASGLLAKIKRKISVKKVAEYSKKIGHSLDYELKWARSSSL